ncbi:hypothetical protein QAD02_010198 [Eretmocerus hayati]|uniref:Uncharacterized protein n=1 Tax=Eretmocerus hayati TaxID=131215 RepID=A0ACC2NG15_9HYME|nr:hypothetical protein QAD02_010198 [Eretmocerus hayati]
MSSAPGDDSLDGDSFFSEMLSSQSDLEDQMLTDHSLELKLVELQKFLSKQSIRSAPIDILDEKVFNVALCHAKEVYFKVVDSISLIVKDERQSNIEDVKNQLAIMESLLRCWDLCMDHIKSFEKISVSDIKSFPASLFEIIGDALNHCKNSEKFYGPVFRIISDSLTSIFRQCVSTLNSFYALIDSVIIFDVNQANEMDILLQIINETGKIAALSCRMDAKTLTDMWKRFGKLSTTFCLEMKNISSDTVTNHFGTLSENISSILSTISQKSPRQTNEKSVMCCRVLLKILEKLTESYCGWIRNNVMLQLNNMLAHLYSYTEQCLKLANFASDLIKVIETNLTSSIEPFLDVIFKNDSFRVAFLDYGKNVPENHVGYHLLLLTVVEKISILPYEKQREWYGRDRSLIDSCFRSIDRLTEDICVGGLQIKLSRNVAQGTYLANIYESTCVMICVMVSQIPNSDFSELEIVLLKYLLTGNFFSALLSSDVWCFTCRLGSSKLCYQHFQYLVGIHQKLRKRSNSFNVVVLSDLIRRLFTLLAESNKTDFINSIHKNSDPHTLRPVGRVLDAKKKEMLQRQLDVSSTNERISDDLKALEVKPSLSSLQTLMRDLLILEVCDARQDEKFHDVFMTMWKKLVYLLGECEGTPSDILEDLAVLLLRATKPQKNQSRYMTFVIECLASLHPYVTSKLRLPVCTFIARLASEFDSSCSSALGELFCRLLSDSDPCVQQQSLESFEQLTMLCPDQEVLSGLAMAIRNSRNESLSRILPAYIAGDLEHRLHGFNSSNEFFKALAGPVSMTKITAKGHRCKVRAESEGRSEKIIKLADGEDRQLEAVVERICKDLEIVGKVKERLSGMAVPPDYKNKLYNDDTILNCINKYHITMDDAEVKANNQHLQRIIAEGLIPKMKADPLFNEIYRNISYAGSFYKGTKVGNPNEYDLDLTMQLPLNYKTLQVETNHRYFGYVKVKINPASKLPKWDLHSQVLNRWVDDKGYLDQDKFRQWMEKVMTKTFDQLRKVDKHYELDVGGKAYKIKPFKKSGPAFTILVTLKDNGLRGNREMDVDIVPCLVFDGVKLKEYRVIPETVQRFLIVAKPVNKVAEGNSLWRLSFYEQEKQILSQYEVGKIKPVIRMIKKLRDRLQWNKKLASYYIETLCLHELYSKKNDSSFFRSPLTCLFIHMLKKLQKALAERKVVYFWHHQHNLLDKLEADVASNYAGRLANILAEIEKNIKVDRFVIADKLLGSTELAKLKVIGKLQFYTFMR